MAYAATVTVTYFSASARRYCLVTVAETQAASGSEWSNATAGQIPTFGKIVSVRSTLTAGTGTTIDPILGRSAAFTASTQNAVWENAAAAAHINATPGAYYYSANGLIVGRSTPNNAAADHAVSTEVLIIEGWED